MSTVKSKKGRRKLKETALSRVRSSLYSGQSVGHPAFWLNIPLPEAHTTHELVIPPPVAAASSFLTHQHTFTSPLTTDSPLLLHTDRRKTTDVGICTENNTDNTNNDTADDGLDAITHIINVATQYGGKVQILQKSNGDLLQFQLSEEDGPAVEDNSSTDESRTPTTTVEDEPGSCLEENTLQKTEENKNNTSSSSSSVLMSEKHLSFNENPS